LDHFLELLTRYQLDSRILLCEFLGRLIENATGNEYAAVSFEVL
jgi:hypothetical protein